MTKVEKNIIEHITDIVKFSIEFEDLGETSFNLTFPFPIPFLFQTTKRKTSSYSNNYCVKVQTLRLSVLSLPEITKLHR